MEVKDTASKTGKSETVIKEKLQIAKNIVPEVQEVIKEKKVTQTDASKIARLEPEQQKKVAEKQKSSLKPQNICYLNPSKKINSTGTKQKKIL